MPKYLPMGDIRTMTYDELERWWELDFEVFVTTAVAEATGPVHPTVLAALESPDWLEQWADGLYAAHGTLVSTVERMRVLKDTRLDKNEERSVLVQQRWLEVGAKVREHLREQGWALADDTIKDARLASMSILARHYATETRAVEKEEQARRGLAPRSPFYREAPFKDEFDAIEFGVQIGVIAAPITPQLQDMMRLPLHELTHIAAYDTTAQDDRRDELRHPLVLRHWLGALVHLRDRHCELAGVAPSFTIDLPRLHPGVYQDLSPEETRQLLNRRRFIRALAQRRKECGAITRQLSRAVGARRAEIEAPWKAAWRVAMEEVARRHPRELQALLSAFEPFCEPGSTLLRRNEVRGSGQVANHVIPLLKKSLADGTWVRLLGEETA
jgi:hypothetical protein